MKEIVNKNTLHFQWMLRQLTIVLKIKALWLGTVATNYFSYILGFVNDYKSQDEQDALFLSLKSNGGNTGKTMMQRPSFTTARTHTA